MKALSLRPPAYVSVTEARVAARHLHCSSTASPAQRLRRLTWSSAPRVFSNAAVRAASGSSLPSVLQLAGTTTATTATATLWRQFSTGGGTHEVINPDDIAFIDSASFPAGSGTLGGTASHEPVSYESSQAWHSAHSPALPPLFTDVEELDVFARPRMLSFVRRYRTEDKQPSTGSSAASTRADFVTEELPNGGVFHARLRLPVTPSGARFVDYSRGGGDDAHASDGLWAHGVANTAKDAELLAAMHAEQMADLLGYHLYSLPSKQRKHAEAARQAGRYASSPDDTGSGPSAQERRAQWPLPLRRILTDEETEGGKWQLVDTSTAATRYGSPEHTLLSPCLLDARARARIEARFASAPMSCPSFARQLSCEKVRTLTASNATDGGVEYVVAQLTLPPALTALAEPIVASGKATDRATAVLLACMHAELLLDTLHVPLFDDSVTQQLHTAAAWSFGRPAPMSGAKPKNPSHMHLPDPLKQLVVCTPTGQRASMRSAEEEFFHRHDIITEQTGNFVETAVGEATAVAVLSRFLEAHHAPRATAAFLHTSLAGHVKSTVVLPLPESYGIRGGVGVAANAEDADVLAAMHALDVLCMLDLPVTVGESAQAARADAAWKAARRAKIPDVPATVSDVATPSPPARRCGATGFASIVSVDGNEAASTVSPSMASTPPAAAGRRRVVKRAKLASEVAAERDVIQATAESAELVKTTPPPPPHAEVVEAEAQIAAARATIDPELWDLKADSPDGFLMIAPGVSETSAVAAHAIVSPRKLDKHAKSRVIDYLSTMGRRLEDVRMKQILDEEETEGRPRFRCALKLPLPSICGEPRVALGEADSAADAEHAACMHAELLLDALGVCIFANPVKQQRHAQACAQWGRWAPSAPGQERPSTTPSPPPLRREHAGSLHWERKKSKGAKRESGFTIGSSQNKSSSAAAVEARQEEDLASAAGQAEDAKEAYDLVPEADIDAVARNRVQYYLRHERLTSGAIQISCVMGRGVMLHIAEWQLPIPPRFTHDAGEGSSATLSYTVKGAASTRKDAEALSWMHAERLLDALGIPIFPNLPQLQAYHAEQAEKNGREAPRLMRGPEEPLPPADKLPVKPLRLNTHARRLDVVRPAPPTLEEAASPVVWEKYVTACETYIAAVQYATNNAYFSQGIAPRTGDVVVDAALAEAEAAPLKMDAVTVLHNYCESSRSPQGQSWVLRAAGELHERVIYATCTTPGFEYVTACGVGESRPQAKSRAAMHALAILRRIDPNYTETYAITRHALTRDLNKAIDKQQSANKADEDEFDLDTFSTLPNITAEAQRVDAAKVQRFHRRLNAMYVGDAAWFKANREFTEDGKRRAVELYVTCCGVAKPKVTELVHLLPREEQTERSAPQSSASPLVQALDLEVKVESVDDTDASTSRVNCGASYATEISFTDEDGHEYNVRAASAGPRENLSGAYEKLFNVLIERSPGMKKIADILTLHVFMRPEEVPSVEIPAAVAERMQECLRNQKDLLLAESETGTWDSAAWEKSMESRWQERRRGASQQSPANAAERAEWTARDRKSAEAVESAALLEKLQARITNAAYLDKYALKRAQLSIAEHKADILQAVRDNPVVIICGTTGCGKTTQIPQYILDEMTQEGRGGACHMIVTQPRRISAVSIARRVAEERMEGVGDSVGYLIRFDSQPGRNITFATTGILLRLLRGAPTLPQFSHLIIDEIHERDLFTDFTLVLLRDLIAKRPDLRVVLMSATLQASEFQRYFNGAPLIQVQGTMFPVKEFFLEDLVPYAQQHQCMTALLKEAELTCRPQRDRSSSSSSGSDAATGLAPQQPFDMEINQNSSSSSVKLRYDVLEVTSKLDFPTICFAVEQATRMMDLSGSSILVFLPGWGEIKRVQLLLERKNNFHVLMLHSALGQEAQMRCFLPAPPGKVKVILSTNIAESGVTIDDVGAVIDCGRAKELSFATRSKMFVPRTLPTGYDTHRHGDKNMVTSVEDVPVHAQSRYTQLLEVYASRANCVQRRGRVGRTRPGICIRLYSRNHFENLHQFQTPQMLRTPLDSLCLLILALRVGAPSEFLRGALEPPLESEVAAAMRRLTDLGALSLDGQLTALGHRLSHLPVEPVVGKTILLGAALRCLDSTLTIAAASQSDLFLTSKDDRTAVRLHREDLSMDTKSDTIASVNAYNFWAVSKLTKPPAQVALDINNRHLRVPTLIQASYLKQQYFDLLVDTGFIPAKVQAEPLSADVATLRGAQVFVDASELSRNALDVGLVKAIITAGCFPSTGVLVGPHVMRGGFDSFVLVSTDSVLRKADTPSTANPFLVYGKLSRFGDMKALSAFDVTIVSFWATLFMGTRSMEMEYLQELSLCVVNGWMYLHIAHRTLELIRKFKALFDRRLGRKFVDPEDAVNNAQLDLVCGILSDLMNAPYRPCPNLRPDLVWEEKGKIIPPVSGAAQLSVSKETEGLDLDEVAVE